MRRLAAPGRKPNVKRPTQLQKLKARLREAEETLEAIQSGAIDGLVINSPNGPSVYTLKGADHAYRVIIENMQEGAATLTRGGAFAYCNRRFAELLGAPLECVVGHQVQAFLVSAESADQLLARAALESVFVEAELRRGDASMLPVHLALSPLPSEDGPGVCVVATDLSDRKRAEQQLRESLHEKEVLLREVHHRVKNNLQLISSLLNMQSRRADDSVHREMLRESRDRVQSIALVHEKLYRSKDLGRIELGRYLADLTTGLVEAYGGGESVEVQVVSEEVELAVDVAIPCALIVNELVSNALKHAFPNGRRGHLTVELKRVDGAAQILVKDDGVGMDPNKRPSRSLGLELVRTLCEELRGELLVKTGEGTAFTVRFPYQREKGWMS